ncbi:MAG: DUF4116 domain-containing protein [Sphingobacteriaceae bacterium]|nr:MAG: DUF4116 domain-containing protein [Sphingobacteriaceae bacterium]
MASTFLFYLIELTKDNDAILDVLGRVRFGMSTLPTNNYNPNHTLAMLAQLPHQNAGLQRLDLAMVQVYVDSVRMDRMLPHIERMIKTIGFYVDCSCSRKTSYLKNNFRSTVEHIMDTDAFDLIESFHESFHESFDIEWLLQFDGDRYHWLITNLIRICMENFPQKFVNNPRKAWYLLVSMPYLKTDSRLVKAAIKIYPNQEMLEILPSLQNDKEIVAQTVSQNAVALRYASAQLRNDRDVVRLAVSRNGNALLIASDDLKNDREIVGLAVSENGMALVYASPALQNDREIVRLAVSQLGWGLQWASIILQNDREIVGLAVSRGGSALRYASAALKDDREIVRLAVTQYGYALQYASANIRNDREIVQLAVSEFGYPLQYASGALKNDRFIVRLAVSRNGGSLQYASDYLRDDKEIVHIAIVNDLSAMEFASQRLKEDHDTVALAFLWSERRKVPYMIYD